MKSSNKQLRRLSSIAALLLFILDSGCSPTNVIAVIDAGSSDGPDSTDQEVSTPSADNASGSDVNGSGTGVIPGQGGVTTPPGDGTAETPPESGAQGPSAESGTSVAAGAPCAVEGEAQCVTMGSDARQLCSAGMWTAANCELGQVCVGGEATCVNQDEFCKGSGGQFVCVGNVLHQCSDDGTSVQSSECASSDSCLLGRANGECTPCIPAQEFKCEGASLLRCASDGSGFQSIDSCPSADLCNADTGACGDAACSAGHVKCEGQQLQQCNASRSGYEMIRNCDPGTTCDPIGQQCDACDDPGQARCEDGKRFLCAEDGSQVTSAPCGADAPICSGNGKCVQCASQADCDGKAGVCQTATCNTAAGECDVKTAMGAPCEISLLNSGVCTAERECVECLSDANCLLKAGRRVCDTSSGQCVPCLKDTDCGSSGMMCVEGEGCVAAPRCGDGIINGDEQCDDGNTSTGDSCGANCTISHYGKCSNSVSTPMIQCNWPSATCMIGGNQCGLLCGDGAESQGLPTECPEVPGAAVAGGPNKWRTGCDLYSMCYIYCSSSGECPPGYRCAAPVAGLEYCEVIQ